MYALAQPVNDDAAHLFSVCVFHGGFNTAALCRCASDMARSSGIYRCADAPVYAHRQAAKRLDDFVTSFINSRLVPGQ